MEFGEEEKTAILAKYFKKYFTERLDVVKNDKEQKIEKEFGL